MKINRVTWKILQAKELEAAIEKEQVGARPMRAKADYRVPRLDRDSGLAQDFGCGLTLTPSGANAAPAGDPG
jgi:hypothetical protein